MAELTVCAVLLVTGLICLGSAVGFGLLVFVGALWLVDAIRGIRLMCAREDRTLDTVARVRARGQA